MNNFKGWIHGLLAAAIGAGATAGSAALAAPDTFNFSHSGLIAFAKIIGIPAAFSALTYLKQSPLPASTVIKTDSITSDNTK